MGRGCSDVGAGAAVERREWWRREKGVVGGAVLQSRSGRRGKDARPAALGGGWAGRGASRGEGSESGRGVA
uniref:Uncharacterized protein n=1 Tax=Arundo donax TaxID=35708 RepID=A0A0A9CZQ5_ARUDO